MQIADLLTHIGRFVLQTIDSLGYGGIFTLMALGAMGIPLPSEVIMPSSGALVVSGRFTLLGITIAGAIGTLIGSLIFYFIGSYIGRDFIIRYGRYILLSQRELTIAENFSRKYGWIALFLGQMLPIVRAYISFPAGVARMKVWLVAVACFLGASLWSLTLGFLGTKLGDNWEKIQPYFRHFDYLLLISLIVLLALAIWFRLRGRSSLT